MCMVPPLVRLASASAVFLGQHGDVSRHADQRGVSRQCLYRQADAVLRDLDASSHQRQIAQLRQQVAGLQVRLEHLLAQPSLAVAVTAEVQAQFASTAQAEGVKPRSG